MKRRCRNRNSQGGQVILEYILMMVVVLTMSFMMKNWLESKKFIQKFTLDPWARLNGMVQCGVWAPCGVESPAGGLHPNTRERILSYDPQ